jgi:hypothetical protein
MANQNLFEKYGIKEVADVTFYRIERKNETYEAQRDISVSSVLKSAIELKTVYPINEDGLGSEEGFEAYVFSDAEVLSGINYPCDDKVEDNPDVENVDVTFTWETDALTATARDIVKNGTPTTEAPDGVNTLLPITWGEPIKIEDDGVQVGWQVTNTYETNAKVDSGVAATHEYSYEQQVLMLFAKNQNLIDKTGVRYQFKDNAVFENIEFNDNFAVAPNSSERLVVVGIANQFTAYSYSVEDVATAIKELTYTFKAKAYDVTYKDYAELLVEDEMGYYNPNRLGSVLGEGKQSIITGYTGEDTVLLNAIQWKENEGCLSINDAIDALKAKKKAIDTGAESTLAGLNGISGGYEVSANGPDAEGEYTLKAGNASVTSTYTLASVMEKLVELSIMEGAVGNAVNVTSNGIDSNRAIYVKVDKLVNTSAAAYIYLLTNVNHKKLATDSAGIFQFEDKKGGTAYYQDEIFAGVKNLALVIIGNKGLIFTVGRNGIRKIEKIAWMVNEKGYITNAQAETLVKNGLIHTVDITVNDETFEATCTVSGLKVRKINKNVNRYVPVLFLDTLKVSTIEQTAETTYATGGRGNANLIGWDFNKEITLTLQDALYTPASMSAMLGSYEGSDFTKGVRETKKIDRMEKCIAKRSFIVPGGNSKGVPSEGEDSAQAVYIEIATMQPYQDGAPIAEGEVYLKWTRSVAYNDNSLGTTIEISAEKFPGTYKIVGNTFARSEATGEDQRFQFVIPKAKVSPETTTITLEAEGDPAVFDMTLTVLRPEDGIMMKLIQYDVVENTEENDGSTMVKDTENLNLLDDAEMFKVSADEIDNETYIGATEY